MCLTPEVDRLQHQVEQLRARARAALHRATRPEPRWTGYGPTVMEIWWSPHRPSRVPWRGVRSPTAPGVRFSPRILLLAVVVNNDDHMQRTIPTRHKQQLLAHQRVQGCLLDDLPAPSSCSNSPSAMCKARILVKTCSVST